jgi:SAM-dependent methyltransferase
MNRGRESSLIETKARVPADLVRTLTSAMWRHVHEPGSAEADSLTAVPDIRHVIDKSPDTGPARELQALVDQVDMLAPAEQRLFTAAIDEVQIRSKLWLIDELTSRRNIDGATVVVLGAWYGILPLLINWRLERPPARMICIDISADACALGEKVIGPLYPNIEYQVADAMDLDYTSLARTRSSVLVNTICEHLTNAAGWWARVPAGQLTVLQSNNYDLCPDHVNCVQDLGQMMAQTPLSELLYEGTLRLPIFDRFMLIGYR